MAIENTFVALLRGINVSGHHKVPMAELRKILEKNDFKNVRTLLASGNVIFELEMSDTEEIEIKLKRVLDAHFSFPIPVILYPALKIMELINDDPFKNIEMHKDIRLYTTFLKSLPESEPQYPWSSDDGSFRILNRAESIVLGVVDVSKTKSTDAMKILEQNYGKNITTRNWNTILKIGAKLN